MRSLQNARRLMPVLVLVANGGLSMARAQTAPKEPEGLVNLRAEVQKLGSELLQVRAELTQWKIESLSAYVQQARAERQRLVSERQVMEREIGELSQGSNNTAGTNENERREELRDVQLPALLASERAAGDRESQLATMLGRETERLNAIRKQLEHRVGGATEKR